MKKLFIATFLFAALCTHAQDPAYPPVPAAPLNIVKAEYFIDADPGFGLGINIPLTAATDIAGLAATINTGALPAGAHRLYLRTLNAEGKWALVSSRQFVVDFDPVYPAVTAAAQNITSAEYFIDTDPGFGNGTNIPLTAAADIAALVANVNTNLLPAGAHRLYIRTRSNEGRWSVTSSSQFIVNADPAYPAAPAAPGNIVAAEYFVDNDPGFGNGTAITLTPGVDISNLSFNANTASLTGGTHHLYVRSLDDWSLTSVKEFLVGSPLPLRFISFTATNAADKILLRWKTADEINTAYFEIERSTDGLLFQKTGTALAANTNGTHDYQQYDLQPVKGVNYYRIKQVDKDGRFTYSAVLRISYGTGVKQLTVYPNPATQYVLADFAGKQKTVLVKLYDAAGRLVYTVTTANIQPLKINTEKLPPGKYLLTIGDGEIFETGSFIKQ